MNRTPTDLYFHSLRVFVSLEAVKVTPVRVHKATFSTGASYHRRVQKKWLKRFGTIRKPCVFMMRHCIVVHPDLMPGLRKELARS